MTINAVNNSNNNGRSDMLREKAAEVVSNVFYGTLMKEFRQGCDSDTMFSGGFGGEAFQQQLDNVFVAEISHQGNNPIVDAMVRQLGGSGNGAFSSVSRSAYSAQAQSTAISAAQSKINVVAQ